MNIEHCRKCENSDLIYLQLSCKNKEKISMGSLDEFTISSSTSLI